MNPNERRILESLTEKAQSAEAIAQKAGVSSNTAYSAFATLEVAGYAKLDKAERVIARLTPEGLAYLKQGTPERRLIIVLKQPMSPEAAAENAGLPNEQRLIAIQWAKRNNWVKMATTAGKTVLELVSDAESPLEAAIKAIGTGEADAEKMDKEAVRLLRSRNLTQLFAKKEAAAAITPAGKTALMQAEETAALTPELLRTGAWKTTKFRPYDVGASTTHALPGKKHVLQMLADEVRTILIQMGFKEMNGPMVESAFWNFDMMFFPQNHPNRDMMDTFYLSKPRETGLPDSKLVERVKAVHESGWTTGSKGLGYSWSETEAARAILRPHTTPASYRYMAHMALLGKGVEKPGKYFMVNRVFRNESIDRTHLPEFQQIEGFVIDKDLNFRHLMGQIAEFYKHLGITKLRFKPVFNPYTEPSAEIFGFHPSLNRWIEIGNSGMFRPETLKPLDIGENVIAWGLALERAAMILFDIDDIRDVMGNECKLEWLREFPSAPAILR